MYKWRNLLLVIGLLFGTNTYSQNKPLACQEDAGGGLKWEDGNWKTAGFIKSRFILVLQGKNLTTSSVAKAINGIETDITCSVTFGGHAYCFDTLGGNILFSPVTMKGATSQLLGGIMNNNSRDSLTVSAFTCQPF